MELSIGRTVRVCEESTHRCQTAAAIEGAEHGAIIDVHCHISTYGTGCLRFTGEATTTTEHVAIHVGGSRGTDDEASITIFDSRTACTKGQSTADVGHSIAHDVTILTTTERRAIDTGIAGDVYFCLSDIGPGVEGYALVALACAEEVTGHRVCCNLRQGAGYTKGAARHVDGTFSCSGLRYQWLTIGVLVVSTHVGQLITTIDAGKDVSASDVHHGVATDRTCVAVPFAWLVRNDAATAAEHVAIEGVTILAFFFSTVGIFFIGVIIIIILVVCRVLIFRIRVVRRCVRLDIVPVSTLSQGFGILRTIVCPFSCSIRTIDTLIGCCVESVTNLAALNLHISVRTNMAVLTAAIDGAFDKGVSCDGYIGSFGDS